jgi:hypothetical protein
MEWNGRWKALQASIRRVFQPLYLGTAVLITPVNATAGVTEASAAVEVFITNDDYAHFIEEGNVAKLAVTVKLVRYDSATSGAVVASLLQNTEVSVAVGRATPHGTADAIYSVTFTDNTLQSYGGCSLATCYLRSTAQVLNYKKMKKSNEKSSSLLSISPLAYLKDVQLAAAAPVISFANLQLVQEDDSSNKKTSKEIRFEISVSQTSPALLLELLSDANVNVNDNSNNNNNSNNSNHITIPSDAKGWFSENKFFAEAGQVYSIIYTSFSKEWTVEEFAARLQAPVLQHAYQCDLPLAKPTLVAA